MTWAGTYLADAACTCRVAGLCSTCRSWSALFTRFEAIRDGMAAPLPPLPSPAKRRTHLRLVWSARGAGADLVGGV
jgi:hypothetical protein